MARKPRNKRKRTTGNEQFWQSYAINQETELMYRDWILSLALNRFKWVNLPETCDERYLEWCLLFNGVASIAHPRKKLKDYFFSTQATQIGEFNVYDNPTKWRSFGNNNWGYECNWSNGVLVYDNRMRRSLLPSIELFSKRLANIERTIDMNVFQQRRPYILTAPQERVNDLSNMAKQLSGFEPMILGYDSLVSDYGVKAEVLPLEVPFIAEQLQTVEQNIWRDIYRLLGIESIHEKGDRLITSEVNALSQPSELMALDPLNARREAADKLNARFGLNIKVVWNEDFISDNYNYVNNVKQQAEAGETE